MLTIVLKILSILGMFLAVLLLLAAAGLLLVLFFPITYRVSGKKDEMGFKMDVKVKWLLGIVRIRYGYPEPGELAAKILFFTLYRAKIPSEEKADECSETNPLTEKALSAGKKSSTEDMPSTGKKSSTEDKLSTGKKSMTKDQFSLEEKSSTEERFSTEENVSGIRKILQKFEKIKYTIHSLYDKIKTIWNNISYYLELLQEEETRQLISHIRFRGWKIIKSVRPRHIRADILFGTGSPDTTGYLYGAYCMFSPLLGDGLNVTPDFEEAVLRGDFTISGHITMWILAVNAGWIALDKRLRRLIRKLDRSGSRKAPRKKAA